jgi:hypothetical protein
MTCNCFHVIKVVYKTGGTQKINLLHKAGGRVVYFGYKHQRKVERGGQKIRKN